ncbi:hypothetical protein Dsin_003481 [Dipteronia sinensis]|uniref:Uncharacterized protein n=1 Tax=Dipteronia sinensis TaxID=43782 RepID=A0AAE0B931_9ROSI|nr:hypothetical protein Dsin_003481 [Dipteronia sinensis]
MALCYFQQTFEHQSFESELCYTFRSDDFAWSVQKSMKSKRKHGGRAQPRNQHLDSDRA